MFKAGGGDMGGYARNHFPIDTQFFNLLLLLCYGWSTHKHAYLWTVKPITVWLQQAIKSI